MTSYAPWRVGELTPLERRTIVSKMVDRVILVSKMVDRVILRRANQTGTKTSADIAERVQIVLKGYKLLVPAPSAKASAGRHEAL